MRSLFVLAVMMLQAEDRSQMCATLLNPLLATLALPYALRREKSAVKWVSVLSQVLSASARISNLWQLVFGEVVALVHLSHKVEGLALSEMMTPITLHFFCCFVS